MDRGSAKGLKWPAAHKSQMEYFEPFFLSRLENTRSVNCCHATTCKKIQNFPFSSIQTIEIHGCCNCLTTTSLEYPFNTHTSISQNILINLLFTSKTNNNYIMLNNNTGTSEYSRNFNIEICHYFTYLSISQGS